MRSHMLGALRALAVSVLAVIGFCSCSSVGIAAGLFDGLLPTPSPIPAVVSTDAIIKEPKEIDSAASKDNMLSLENATSLDEFVDELAEKLGQPIASQSNNKSTLCYSVPVSYVEELFSPFARVGITKLSVDFEKTTILIEFENEEQESSSRITQEAEISLTNVEHEYCSACNGSGECSQCFLGECEYCFGDGEYRCTGGCIGGRCIACDDGYTLVRYDINDNPVYRRCSYCRNGECKKCGGEGYIKCTYCKGTGDCKYCEGTGECKYCDGTGRQ